ncbi:MAG: tyrosine-type recombinase/integrase [Planctomycetota bacterium]
MHRNTLTWLIALYRQDGRSRWVKATGRQTRTASNVRSRGKRIVRLLPAWPVDDLTPRVLADLQRRVADESTPLEANAVVSLVRTIIRWGEHPTRELVPPGTTAALQAVTNLKAKRRRVRPVPWTDVLQTMRHMPADIAALVMFCAETGCRPGEARTLRYNSVVEDRGHLVYLPEEHKTEHYGVERRILILPAAEDILERQARSKPGRVFGFSPDPAGLECYSESSVSQAVRRACDAAGVKRWTPNQIRHTRLSEIRREFGLDAARAVGGHTSTSTTEIYAEIDSDKAVEALRLQAGLGDLRKGKRDGRRPSPSRDSESARARSVASSREAARDTERARDVASRWTRDVGQGDHVAW